MPAHLKDESVRARRNRATTRRVFDADGEHDFDAPELPDCFVWHQLTRQWWDDIWASPMATEYLDVDINGLLRVAMLMNDFWLADSLEARNAAQVRLEKADAEYGTNPLARRRLEWQIETTKESQRKGRKRRADDGAPPAPQPAPTADPRLKLVQ